MRKQASLVLEMETATIIMLGKAGQATGGGQALIGLNTLRPESGGDDSRKDRGSRVSSHVIGQSLASNALFKHKPLRAPCRR